MIAAAFALALLALLARELWLGYPPARFVAAALSKKEQAVLAATAEAFFPRGGALPSAEQAGVVPYVDRMMHDMPRRQRILLRLLFVLVEHGSLLFGPVHRRMTRQSVADRIATLRAWELSSLYFRRLSFLSLRTLMTLAYFGDAAVRQAVTAA